MRREANQEINAGYEIEELLPIVAGLSEKYTSKESSSVTYEAANQLMEAVLYTIKELFKNQEGQASTRKKLPAKEAYEAGERILLEKVKKSLSLYHEILSTFDFYENRCYQETVLKGIPRFFQKYDSRFCPQDTILTLDYPVLLDLTKQEGIDRIESYLWCIHTEQLFLQRFPRPFVLECLASYQAGYQGMIDNLAEIVYTFVVSHILMGKSIEDGEVTSDDKKALKEIVERTGKEEIKRFLKKSAEELVTRYYDGDRQLKEYLLQASQNILARPL